MSLQFPARLSAAALGAAVLVGVAAAPAHAATWTPEHGTPSGTFVSADDDLMEFVLYDNFATEDIRAVVVTASGEETEIQVDFITEDDMGAVFMHDIEQVLGGDLAQPYEVHVYGAGQLAFGAAFAADGTMTPIEAEEFIPFEDWAEVATWRVYTDQNATVVESLVTEDGGVPSPIDAELTVAPKHGTVEIGGTSFGYTPEKDFLGTDTFTVVMTANGVTRTVEFTVEVLDLPGDSTPTPIDPAPAPEPQPEPEPEPEPAPEEPTDPAPAPEEPAEPEQPAEPVVDEDEPAAPAPEQPAEDGHTVPDTVETGNGSAWGLAAIGALAAGVLVRLRRTFGLA
ncbi:MAG: Ig-like domain-containing protein [Actinomycetota bacterium]|nr:Ig-like domain-containing protein [Micrococcus luteus]